MTDSTTDQTPAILLSDGVVTVRPWQPADADEIFRAIDESRTALQRWLPAAASVTRAEDARSYILLSAELLAAGTSYDFVIEDALSQHLLGNCGLTQVNRNHQFCNLYYWVRSDSTRAGVARRAIRLAARFGLEGIGLSRIEIVVEPDNIASLRAAEAAGATREGILRNRLSVHGTARDAVMFSLIPEDFQ